jgi:hypothetical protein
MATQLAPVKKWCNNPERDHRLIQTIKFAYSLDDPPHSQELQISQSDIAPLPNVHRMTPSGGAYDHTATHTFTHIQHLHNGRGTQRK